MKNNITSIKEMQTIENRPSASSKVFYRIPKLKLGLIKDKESSEGQNSIGQLKAAFDKNSKPQKTTGSPLPNKDKSIFNQPSIGSYNQLSVQTNFTTTHSGESNLNSTAASKRNYNESNLSIKTSTLVSNIFIKKRAILCEKIHLELKIL